MSDLVELMKASLGPGVALMGVAVAAAQWHTNDVKLRLDSYDRRLRVYKATVAMLESAIVEIRRRRVPNWRKSNKTPTLPYAELPEEVVRNFQDCLLEASFLFDREVTHKMHYINTEVRNIRMYATALAKKEPSELLEKSGKTSLRELREAEARIEKLDRNIEEPFRRYLKLQRFQK
ncbi:hypothetical protein Q6A26_21835 [Xanthomonas euvesicatoria pv. eucalypti]|uniref:hypothetical protein n=1 Tax=Xanthomonas euvesicatoria TaxID=456327 RepID=UPI0026E25216|nr:hypothetical protein [Xanthomonas euvesicatoria]MDO7934626.1 hypothetical protein [Xanthomonas euvesicatoria pv. eucalypti]MDO7938796.1 hypothetical protein [Xanthomonas euvesicatoria pv. eucalypti]MDO7943009.1 hypothetical protein [Xanthomonas euvesicatoria pv. eucalypti]MDO7947201.1 hypothetical protein [Xanthomonas euvesicatoria pv. eucalypti]MDO7950490.1 hypothetical protein [Xanthomonas euvesicatoria pv. eucalypti]